MGANTVLAPHPAGACVVRAPEAGEDRHLADHVAFRRGVDHSAVAEVNTDMRDRLSSRVRSGKEDQISWLELIPRDWSSGVELLLGGAGNGDPKLPVYPLHQSGTIEAGLRAGAAPDIGLARLSPRQVEHLGGECAGRQIAIADGYRKHLVGLVGAWVIRSERAAHVIGAAVVA